MSEREELKRRLERAERRREIDRRDNYINCERILEIIGIRRRLAELEGGG